MWFHATDTDGRVHAAAIRHADCGTKPIDDAGFAATDQPADAFVEPQPHAHADRRTTDRCRRDAADTYP